MAMVEKRFAGVAALMHCYISLFPAEKIPTKQHEPENCRRGK
jgi:hypothetical protein